MEVFIAVLGTLLIIAVAIGVIYGLRWLCLKSTGSYSRYAGRTNSPYYIERSTGASSCPHRYYADYDSFED